MSATTSVKSAARDFAFPRAAGRTAIKICGLSREADVEAAVAAGADAIGLVFYAPSPRCVSPARAAELAACVPADVARVALLVNADDETFDAVCHNVSPDLLQFHGDETPQRCLQLAARAGLPWLRAARVGAQGLATHADLLEFARQYQSASALLLDAFVSGYGGGGHVFDWSLIPESWRTGTHSADAPPVVLSGGLNSANVAEAIARARPTAVDVSSGVEDPAQKGLKDPVRIAAFVAAVRAADAVRQAH